MPTPVTEEHLTRTRALLNILQREHAALLAGDLEQIEAIVQAKQAAIAQLEALTREVAHAMSGGEQRHQLEALAIECRRQNEINGGMVEASLRHTQRMLSILRGQNLENDLYSRAGNALPGNHARPLAKA